MDLGVFALPIKRVCIIVFSGFVLLSAQVPGGNISPGDLETCKQTVTSYCGFWKALKFDSMLVKLSSDGMGQLPKAKFINTYGLGAGGTGKLSTFTVEDAIANDGGVLVKMNCTFGQELSPAMVNGVHSFHMVKDGEVWKIKTIVAPVPVPEAESGTGGSHPGE